MPLPSCTRSEEHTSELQSLRHLVYLHSFPTRRSSDLRPASRRTAARCSAAGRTGSRPTAVTALCHFPHAPDRKSTRLNSSHLGISYIYTLSLHDALPICALLHGVRLPDVQLRVGRVLGRRQ